MRPGSLRRDRRRRVPRCGRLGLSRLGRRRRIKPPRQERPEERRRCAQTRCDSERKRRHPPTGKEARKAVRGVRQRGSLEPAAHRLAAVQRDHRPQSKRHVSRADHSSQHRSDPARSLAPPQDSGRETRGDRCRHTHRNPAPRKPYRYRCIVHGQDRSRFWRAQSADVGEARRGRTGRVRAAKSSAPDVCAGDDQPAQEPRQLPRDRASEVLLCDAAGGIRTPTPVRTIRPERIASASSATAARDPELSS